MKTLKSFVALSLCVSTSVFAGMSINMGNIIMTANGNYGSGQTSTYSQNMVSIMPTYTLSEAQKADLLYMWEEEKLAKDVYTKMFETWGAAVFSNIATSELMHQNSVASLLTKYSLEYPSSEEAGVFQNSTLQALYDELVAKGLNSLDDALSVGVTIEETDIADLEAKIDAASDDAKVVYEHLLNGSYNHLSAFQAVIDGTNVQTGVTNTNCDGAAMLNAVGSGWHLVGTSYSGCTMSGLKAQGAKNVYRYSYGQNGWTEDDNITANEGFWIYK